MKKNLLLFLSFFVSFLFAQNHEANDCVNYIQVCSNETVTLNPSGYGVQELDANVCNSEEHNSLWIRFTAKTTGTLGFDLIPTDTNLVEDYDFWIFGPNVSCGSLGQSIRCSTTNPLAAGLSDNHTGLRDSEPDGDFFEGPGTEGDGYIKSLNVIAGESYFLVIDRPIGNSSFSLTWTGTATLDDAFGEAPFSFGKVPDLKICNPSSIFDFRTLDTMILNNNPDFSVSYYETAEDATYDINRILAPISIFSKKYYYRIQSTRTECFRVEEINVLRVPLTISNQVVKACKVNSVGVFNLAAIVFPNVSTTSVQFYHSYSDALAHSAGTEISNLNYTSAGETLYAWVVATNGCETIVEVELSFYKEATLDTSRYNGVLCDVDLDNEVTVIFSNITPQIVSDYKDFKISYYLASNPTAVLPDSFKFNQRTPVVVKVESLDGCAPIFGTIIFDIAPKIQLNTVAPISICDNKLEGSVAIDLADYKDLFATNVITSYYLTRDDARKNVNAISSLQTINADTTFYLRFDNGIECADISALSIVFKSPKKAINLQDVTICKEKTIDLEAGAGFQAYLWSNGSVNSNSGEVGVGDYWVDLTFNDCVYRQYVKVLAEEDIIIKYIEIENNTAVVHVSGGSQPYEYSLDGRFWQLSNVFYNVPKGVKRVYVRSALHCTPIIKEFYNINLVNTITPNGDGKNDVLDFSGLRLKQDVKFRVIDRNGKIVFESKDHQYIWGGGQGLAKLPTATYWYILEWTEPDTGLKVQYKSWVLVKNRN